jgi:hypothetical protein
MVLRQNVNNAQSPTRSDCAWWFQCTTNSHSLHCKIICEKVQRAGDNGKVEIMEKIKIKFKVISHVAANAKYPEAFNEDNEEGLTDLIKSDLAPSPWVPGEVKIPGYGWYLCVITRDVPEIFYSDDDGWQEVPKGCVFERLVKVSDENGKINS